MIEVKERYSIQEVADMLFVDTSTIRKWEKNKTIDIVDRSKDNGYRYFNIYDVINIAKKKGINRIFVQ